MYLHPMEILFFFFFFINCRLNPINCNQITIIRIHSSTRKIITIITVLNLLNFGIRQQMQLNVQLFAQHLGEITYIFCMTYTASVIAIITEVASFVAYNIRLCICVVRCFFFFCFNAYW